MGLYLVHVYIDGRNTGRVSLAKKEIIITLIYLLLISLMPSVDFFGHLGGLISGAMIGTCIIALFETPRVKLHLLGSFGLTLLYSGLLFTFYAWIAMIFRWLIDNHIKFFVIISFVLLAHIIIKYFNSQLHSSKVPPAYHGSVYTLIASPSQICSGLFDLLDNTIWPPRLSCCFC